MMLLERENNILEEICFPTITRERCLVIAAGVVIGAAISLNNPVILLPMLKVIVTAKPVAMLYNGVLGGAVGSVLYSATKGAVACYSLFFDNLPDAHEDEPVESDYQPPEPV